MFRGVEGAVRADVQALRIAMAIGKDMAHHSVDLRIVRRNRPVQVHPDGLAHVGNKVFICDFLCGGQALCFNRDAEIRQLVVSLVTDSHIQLLIVSKFQPSAVVVVAGRQPGEDIDRLRKRSSGRVVSHADDLRIQEAIRALRVGDYLVCPFSLIKIAVRDVHKVITGTFQEFRMQGHAQQPVLASRDRYFIDGDGNFLGAIRGVDPRNALARPFGDPEHVVRSPGHFPRAVEAGNHHALLELLRSTQHGIRRILRQS